MLAKYAVAPYFVRKLEKRRRDESFEVNERLVSQVCKITGLVSSFFCRHSKTHFPEMIQIFLETAFRYLLVTPQSSWSSKHQEVKTGLSSSE